MDHDRQENDPMRDRDSRNSRTEPRRPDERMPDQNETDLERAQIEGNLGNERVRRDHDDDRSA